MLEMEDVKVYNALKRIINDEVKLGNELQTSYPINILKEKKIRQEVKMKLTEEGYIKDEKLLIIPDKYMKLYKKIKEERNKISQDILLENKKRYKELFTKSRKQYLEEEDFTFSYFKQNLKEMLTLAEKIHFDVLPEYSNYLIYNRGVLPEENLKEFYDHYHSLEYLFEWIENEEQEKSKLRTIGGDINLDKELTFVVFSKRWGHKDSYIVKRTIKGWDCIFFNEYSGDKTGKVILDCMKHDYISYPSTLEYLFEELWEIADREEMTEQSLQKEIDKISKWVIQTEENKPDLFN